MQNFVKIGLTIVEILQFFNLQDNDSSACWIFKILNFY